MKKYTIIYADIFCIDNKTRHAIPKYALIETENLALLLDIDDRFTGKSVVIFKGWCSLADCNF